MATIAAMLASDAWPSLVPKKRWLYIVKSPEGVSETVVISSATSVPNRKNGRKQPFLGSTQIVVLVSIANHWEISL